VIILFTKDIINLNSSILVSVQLREDLENQIKSKFIHLPSDRSQKLIKVNLSWSVSVEKGEQLSDLLLVKANAKILASFLEFG